jgi:hypothetical protein
LFSNSIPTAPTNLLSYQIHNSDALQLTGSQCIAPSFRFDLGFARPASLLFVSSGIKRSINVWGSPRADLTLMRRLKSAFDPQNTDWSSGQLFRSYHRIVSYS